MYEFVGAIAGRTVMIEGQLNSTSLVTGTLGYLVMSLVSIYTKEPLVDYIFVFIKYVVSWLLLSSLLGSVKAVTLRWRFPVDTNPRTRAWENGPKLPGWMRAIRDLGSALLSVFYPLDPRMTALIESGLGWSGVGVSLGSLLVFLAILEYLQDVYPVVAPPAVPGSKEKSL